MMDEMLKRPILVSRQIVCISVSVKLCRPSETILDLLDRLPPGPLNKEDASQLIDAQGRRV